eukprot:CAMPEP_0182486050 /NCGR_PEP_ID=MMETSP1319-20130603/46354_1 /TAXON_ID=172717 /ORGANISM="Bolidomonas pacifica, Strain RCC208" /LENGTH=40 /DNA_ID= /DNA_START= /DNA_END= /DNA_ORIENTATION=
MEPVGKSGPGMSLKSSLSPKGSAAGSLEASIATQPSTSSP